MSNSCSLKLLAKGLLTSFTVLLCINALAQPPAAAQSLPTNIQGWFEPAEPLHIVGPIYYVGTRDLAAYLITTPAGHILLDGAMPASAGLIEASIRKLGFKPEEIRQLLITQAHIDHVGTLAHFKKLSGAAVTIMEADAALLKSGGRLDYLFSKVQPFQFEGVAADRMLKDRDTVKLGGVTLQARHTPGHTRGCTTWMTSVSDAGRSYAVVFLGSTTVNPGTKLVREPSYPGIAEDYRHSFDLLDSLQPDIWLAAHASLCDFDEKRGRVATDGAKAFVDARGYRRRLAGDRTKFQALLAKEETPGPPLPPAKQQTP